MGCAVPRCGGRCTPISDLSRAKFIMDRCAVVISPANVTKPIPFKSKQCSHHAIFRICSKVVSCILCYNLMDRQVGVFCQPFGMQ